MLCYERRLVSATTATMIPMMATVPRPQTSRANEGLMAFMRSSLTHAGQHRSRQLKRKEALSSSVLTTMDGRRLVSPRASTLPQRQLFASTP